MIPKSTTYPSNIEGMSFWSMLCVVISFFFKFDVEKCFLKDLGDVDNLFVSLDISTFNEAHSKFDLLVIGEV
jgi:hypothetical protein